MYPVALGRQGQTTVLIGFNGNGLPHFRVFDGPKGVD